MNNKWTKILGLAAGILGIVTPLLTNANQQQEMKKMVQKEVQEALKNQK
jgi:hypothetical protein